MYFGNINISYLAGKGILGIKKRACALVTEKGPSGRPDHQLTQVKLEEDGAQLDFVAKAEKTSLTSFEPQWRQTTLSFFSRVVNCSNSSSQTRHLN